MTKEEFNLNEKMENWENSYKTSWKYLKIKGYIDAEKDGDCIFLNVGNPNALSKLKEIQKEFINKLKDDLDIEFENGDIGMSQYHRRRDSINKHSGFKDTPCSPLTKESGK